MEQVMAQERSQPSKKGAEVLARIADGFTLRKSALGGATLRKGTLRFRVAEATLGKLVREGHLLEARDDDGRVIYLPPSEPGISELRARYAELGRLMDEATKARDYARRAALAREALPIEEALNRAEAEGRA